MLGGGRRTIANGGWNTPPCHLAPRPKSATSRVRQSRMSYAQQGGMQQGAPQGRMAEGVPPQQYLLMVQANQLVPVNRKISATAASLEELEAILAGELGLQVQVGVCLQDPASGQWYQVPSAQQIPLKAKVMVNPLQPRGHSEAEMAMARERQLQYMLLRKQEMNRIREEEMRMKEKEFEYQRSLAMLEARKRAAMTAMSALTMTAMTKQAADPAPAGVRNAYIFMVVENELVKNKQKVEVTAGTMTMVEATLQSALKLRMDLSVFVDGALVSDISQLPAKGKIEVRPRQANAQVQVVEVAAAGKEYKLLVCENEMAAQNFKIKVVANSMEELEDAIAAKLGIEVSTQAICRCSFVVYTSILWRLIDPSVARDWSLFSEQIACGYSRTLQSARGTTTSMSLWTASSGRISRRWARSSCARRRTCFRTTSPLRRRGRPRRRPVRRPISQVRWPVLRPRRLKRHRSSPSPRLPRERLSRR